MNPTIVYKEIVIPVDNINLKGNLRLGTKSKGMVIFSHGSGSSRMSIRNNYVADLLYENGFSSLLFDLLTEKEDIIYENRFNIELLTTRLIKVIKWISKNKETKDMPIGLFGASTGAASALWATAILDRSIKAVVSRGGRPDLAMSILKKVKVPTLLLVGGDDGVVIELNNKAQEEILGTCELKIIEGASHLFSEPGKLEIVANLTSEWFDKYMTKSYND
ncbi:MAG: dienelactone hydrolase family protein [Flavobacteriaceae bacterium]|nr:dienelactone hydrolase family protein [Flavobacteriaceae bacterium]